MARTPGSPPRFSKSTLDLIAKASRAKRADWLERNREDYERHLLMPLLHLAQHLKAKLSAPGGGAEGYHFPQRGIGRLKRSSRGAIEYGGPFRDYVSYSASRPSGSRFDRNPNLFFLIYPADEDGDQVLIAGGLYMPSSRQIRAIREAIAADGDGASAFDRLFASKSFAARFPGGFSREKTASRPPRGFDKEHPRMEWLKLQAFFVWRSYSRREFASAEFADLVANDFAQITRLNALLELALQGRLPAAAPKTAERTGLITRLEEIEAPRRRMDF